MSLWLQSDCVARLPGVVSTFIAGDGETQGGTDQCWIRAPVALQLLWAGRGPASSVEQSLSDGRGLPLRMGVQQCDCSNDLVRGGGLTEVLLRMFCHTGSCLMTAVWSTNTTN